MKLLQRLKNLFLPEGEVSDGEPCFGGGWFIVMADLPTGQVSNHYRIEEWNLFKVPIKDKADVWDGHTPVEAANRLYEFCLHYSNPI